MSLVQMYVWIPIDCIQVRTSWDDVVVYKPYSFPQSDSEHPFTSNLRWVKLDHPLIANWEDMEDVTSEEGSRLKPLADISGYSAVFIKGKTSHLILKEASSTPHILELRISGLQDLTSFHTLRCEKGFAYIGQEVSDFNNDSDAELLTIASRASYTKPSFREIQSMARRAGPLANSCWSKR